MEHEQKCEIFKNKSADTRELVEKQEKENKKLAIRITAKKEEYEDRTKRIKSLMDEVEKT